MKLISFEHNGQASFGAVVDGDRIVDLKPLLNGQASDLKSLIAQDLVAAAAAAVQNATSFLSLQEVDLLPVIPNPGQIFCIGLNYGEHVRETGKQVTECPVIFMRVNESQVAHGKDIVRPPESHRLDYEGGIAIVIGKGGRRISEADRFTRAGHWTQGRFPLSSKIGGKVCGIVGLGNIGQAVARRAQAFDMAIHYYNPRSRPDVPYTRHESLVALAQQADFLVLTLPGGAATRHIINAEVLQALGPQGYLINIARGSVVDQQALVDALETGQIAGAGLDVFEQEPQVPDVLRQRDNVVITPHIASSTRETMAAMADLVFENMLAFARGEPVLTRVV